MDVDTYQQRARECLRFAATSFDLEERMTWRELALCWLRLSEHAEELSSHGPREAEGYEFSAGSVP